MGAAEGGKWSFPEGFDLRHMIQEQADALYALGKRSGYFRPHATFFASRP